MDRLPGFRDFYPEPLPTDDAWSADARRFIFDRWRDTAHRYGFREYDGPPLEPLELFTVKSGDEIVGQLYNFTDKGGREVALRPEMTPTLARMVAAHQRQYKKPMKWFSIPQLFRHERQQKGRLREHFQLNADVIGESDPAADAELIALLIDCLRALGLSAGDFVVRLSSRNAWQEFYAKRSANTSGVLNFYQIIDKLEREPEEVSAARLAELGFSLEEVRAFINSAEPTFELDAILRNLAARDLARFVRIDYGIIRGLAYYTGPVFEAFDSQRRLRAIAGGGRYDNLVKLISWGKLDLPALGFGMGDVVITELLKEKGLMPKSLGLLRAYCLIEDEGLREPSLKLVQNLREAGLSVDYPLVPIKPDKQFKRAREMGVEHTVSFAALEDGQPGVKVRRLCTHQEWTLGWQEAIALLKGATPTTPEDAGIGARQDHTSY